MTLKVKYLLDFALTNGAQPSGKLITNAHGDLLGTTTSDVNLLGKVFEILNTSAIEAPIYSTSSINLVNFKMEGQYPNGNLVSNAHGDLLGTTAHGGSDNKGTVFEVPNTGTTAAPIYSSVITLLNFNGGNGEAPDALSINELGDLLGTTNVGGSLGGGIVFKICNKGTLALPIYDKISSTLVEFGPANGYLYNGLTFNGHGDLVGLTASGGSDNNGTVFEIANTGTLAAPIYSNTAITLASFNASYGPSVKSGFTLNEPPRVYRRLFSLSYAALRVSSSMA